MLIWRLFHNKLIFVHYVAAGFLLWSGAEGCDQSSDENSGSLDASHNTEGIFPFTHFKDTLSCSSCCLDSSPEFCFHFRAGLLLSFGVRVTYDISNVSQWMQS